MSKQTLLSQFYAFYEEVGGEFCDFQVVANGEKLLKTLIPAAAIPFLHVIGRQKNGSLICFWQQFAQQNLIDQPIVWLDSEGSPFSVFASNFHVFLSLLPYDTGSIYDMIAAWEEYAETGEDWIVSVDRFSADTLKMYEDMAQNNYPHHEQFINWLKKMGVEPASDPFSLIGKAIEQLPALRTWLATWSSD